MNATTAAELLRLPRRHPIEAPRHRERRRLGRRPSHRRGDTGPIRYGRSHTAPGRGGRDAVRVITAEARKGRCSWVYHQPGQLRRGVCQTGGACDGSPQGLAWDGCKTSRGPSGFAPGRAPTPASAKRRASSASTTPTPRAGESERCNHPVPLAVLWSRDAVPDAQLETVIEQIRSDRGAAVERSLLSTPEGAAPPDARANSLLSGLCLTILDLTARRRPRRSSTRPGPDDMRR